jgi:hypothetical protein
MPYDPVGERRVRKSIVFNGEIEIALFFGTAAMVQGQNRFPLFTLSLIHSRGVGRGRKATLSCALLV